MASFQEGDDEVHLLTDKASNNDGRMDGQYGGYKSSENFSASEEKPEKHSIKYNLKDLVLGHIFLVLMLMSFMTAAIASQMAITENNVFYLNGFRYSFQAAVSFILGVLMKHSFKVKKEYWKHAIGGILAHIAYGLFFYLAISSMPLGNTQALFTAIFTVLTTLLDLCRKIIDKIAVMTTLITILGIIVLIQPWALKKEGGVSVLPCSLLESHTLMNNHTNVGNITNNVTILDNTNDDTAKHQLIGYMFILSTAISAVAYSYLIKELVSEHPFTVPNVYLGVFGAFVSFLINLTQKRISHEPFYSFPHGKTCILFLCLFITCSLAGVLFETCCLKYLHVSERAVSGSIQIILLYVIQRTFLREFHPGKGNMLEVIGVVIIIVSNIAGIVNRFMKTDT